MVMACPGCNMVWSPPADSDRYLPPSRLSLAICALLSFGSANPFCTDRVTTAR